MLVIAVLACRERIGPVVSLDELKNHLEPSELLGIHSSVLCKS